MKRILGWLLLIVGGMGVFSGFSEYEARLGDFEAQALSVTQLLESGYGDNAHVSLHGFVPLEQPLIRATPPQDSAEDNPQGPPRWTTCVVPLIPNEGDLYEDFRVADFEERMAISREVPVRVLVRSTIRDEEALEAFYANPPQRLRGILIQEHEPLNEWEQERLADEYPQTNLDGETLLILAQDHPPLRHPAVTLATLGGGGFLMLLGMLVMLGAKSHGKDKQKVKSK